MFVYNERENTHIAQIAERNPSYHAPSNKYIVVCRYTKISILPKSLWCEKICISTSQWRPAQLTGLQPALALARLSSAAGKNGVTQIAAELIYSELGDCRRRSNGLHPSYSCSHDYREDPL